ncbi:uncharacterized protein LOC134548495 [Prinia subflava]|uniref:uncharacterized protein LOC134548495 n=1 Tax=Prinia subflava TaxID=208062 RepID=UPI002FE29F53
MFQLYEGRTTGAAAEVQQGAVCVRKRKERGAVVAKDGPLAPLTAGPVPPAASASPETPPQQPRPANSSTRHQHVPPRCPAEERGCRAADPLWATSPLPTCSWAQLGSAGIRLGSPRLALVRLSSPRFGCARLSAARLLSVRSSGPAPPEATAWCARRGRWAWSGGRPELSGGLAGCPRPWEGGGISRLAGRALAGVRSGARPCFSGPGLSASRRGHREEAAVASSVQGERQMTLKPFTYPLPETRFLHAGRHVYKFKIRYGSFNSSPSLSLTESAAKESEEVVRVILGNLDDLHPFSTDHFTVFPYLSKWERVSKMKFKHENVHLVPYPYICTLYLELNSFQRNISCGKEVKKGTDELNSSKANELEFSPASLTKDCDQLSLWEPVEFALEQKRVASQAEGAVQLLQQTDQTGKKGNMKSEGRGLSQSWRSIIFALLQHLFGGKK